MQTSAAAGSALRMTFNIRAALAGDVPAMHHVRNKVRENRLSDAHQISTATYLPYVHAGTIWVAETDTGIIGFAALNAPFRSVWAFFVAPEAEGIGIGRALHSQMLTWAREQGIQRLTLSTAKGTRAEQFYKRAGWSEAGITADGEQIFEIALPR